MSLEDTVIQLRTENQALREEAESLRTLLDLLESSLDGIWDWDMRTNNAYLSPRWKAMMGYTEEELPGRFETWEKLLLPEDGDKAVAALNDHLERGLPYAPLLRQRRKDGSIAWMASRGQAVRGENGEWVRMAGTNTDVTKVKETEQSLRESEERYRKSVLELEERTEELERSNHDLEQFAYVASHDLRSPLRAIAQLASWIQEDLGDDIPPDVAEHIRLMRDRIIGLETLHQGLLSYARAGRSQVRAEDVDLQALTAQVWQMLEPPAGFRLEASDLPVVRVERVAIQQCVHNLIDNALKHHDRDSGAIQVTAAVDRGALTLRVCDDGPGIGEHFREQIFEMFQTLKSRDKGGGSGLGLALVRKLALRARGDVTLLPSEGRGATFQLTWTLAEETV